MASCLDLGQRKYVRTEDVAASVAEAVRENHFLVKYDKTTAPMIDAAVMRNIGYKDVVDKMAERSKNYVGYREFLMQNA